MGEVTHSFVSAVADDVDDDLVRPSDWNADHDVTLTAADVGAAPDSVDYLVGTASGGLSGEIAVGTSPGGELGGTWASPTVDATHSGSAHHNAITIGADGEHSLSTQVLSGVDAGASQKGHIQIAGDLAGTAAAPTVASIANGLLLLNAVTSTVTGTNNDLTLASTTGILNWNGGAAATITGLTDGVAGRLLLLVNQTTDYSLTLPWEDSGSAAGNRFSPPNSATVVLLPKTWCLLSYSGSRWRVLPGHAVDTTAGANATIDGSGTTGTAGLAAASGHGHRVNTTDAPSGANITIDAAASAASTGSIARAGHGHRLNTSSTNPVALGAAAPGTSGHSPSRDDHVHPTTGLSLTGHGAADHTDVTRTIFIPARGFSGSSFTAVDTGTASTRNAVPDATLVGSLADAATQGHLFMWALPEDAKATTAVNIRIAYRPNSTDANATHTIRWTITAQAMADGTTMATAGTGTTYTSAARARTADVMCVDTSTQILASTSAGDILRIDVRRIGADAADSYVGVVDLVGIYVDYTATG